MCCFFVHVPRSLCSMNVSIRKQPSVTLSIGLYTREAVEERWEKNGEQLYVKEDG